METDNTFTFLVAAVIIIHFLDGFGYIIYKLSGPIKKKTEED